MKSHIFSLICASALALTACEPAPSDKQVPPETGQSPSDVSDNSQTQAVSDAVDQLIATQTARFMNTQPLLSSFNDIPESQVGGPYARRITDYSPIGFQNVRKVARSAHDALANMDREGLSDKDRLNLAVVEDILDYYTGAEGIEYGLIDSYFGHVPYVVSPISGPHLDIPKLMQTQQRLKSLTDAQDYIARLEAFIDAFDAIDKKIKADAELGAIPPRILVEKTIAPIKAFIEGTAADNILVTSFKERITKIEEIDAETQEQLVNRAKGAVVTSVFPAYAKLAETLEDLLDRAGTDSGVWAQPDGEAFYRSAVKALGDTDLSPEEIHAIGLREVDRITAEMDAILKDRGLNDGTVGERMVRLSEDPHYLFADSDEGRAELLSFLRDQVDEINQIIPDYFATIPSQKLEIRRIPVFSQDGEAGGFYTNPSLDGTRPGIYWINLRDMKAWPSWSLNTLTYHEAIPGHHFQVAINMSESNLPLMRRIAPFNAFVEGWALYSEQLAYEMGLYDDDPLGNLGRLQDELFRAVRLVVDTGLHAKRWSREEAIDYMYKTTGADKSEVVPEIERYMAWPGQALGYKLGMLKILELRGEAQTALGDAFDIKEFHDVVLRDGAIPMSVLTQKVQDWVTSKQASPDGA